MNSYTLTSPRMSGHIELQYTDSLLTCILFAIKEPLNAIQFTGLLSIITQFESDVEALTALGLSVSKSMTNNTKIAIFCRLYEKYKHIKYTVSPRESGMIKKVNVDEEMMEAYFKSDNFLFKGKHSIGNLVKYYNELKAEIVAGPASLYPDQWSKTFEDKLNDDDRKDYWKHLRGLGLKPKRDRFGAVTDWYREISNE
jgi:hypothetical protein